MYHSGPAGVGTVGERQAFLRAAGYTGAVDFVPDARLHPNSPWDYLEGFDIMDYDLVVLRRLEDSVGHSASRAAQVRAFIEAGGSAILTGRLWEWTSPKKYNQPEGSSTAQNHPLNLIAGPAGIVLEHGTLHESGVGGIGPATGGVVDSNILYILRYLATLPAAEAAGQAGRLQTVAANIAGAIANTAAAAIDPALWVAMEGVLEAPVCSEPRINYNPTFANPVAADDSQNQVFLAMALSVQQLS
eukprot:SAG22_NODE_292_length_12914_cov_41.306594_5_plen_245_part_00